MPFLIKDDELFEKYNKICGKNSIIIEKEFYIKPVYNEKYLKIKIKSYDEKINTSLHDNKNTKIRLSIYLSIGNIDWFSLQKREKLLPSSVLEKC